MCQHLLGAQSVQHPLLVRRGPGPTAGMLLGMMLQPRSITRNMWQEMKIRNPTCWPHRVRGVTYECDAALAPPLLWV